MQSHSGSRRVPPAPDSSREALNYALLSNERSVPLSLCLASLFFGEHKQISSRKDHHETRNKWRLNLQRQDRRRNGWLKVNIHGNNHHENEHCGSSRADGLLRCPQLFPKEERQQEQQADRYLAKYSRVIRYRRQSAQLNLSAVPTIDGIKEFKNAEGQHHRAEKKRDPIGELHVPCR